MHIPKITEVRPLEDYHIRVCLRGGSTLDIDMSNRLETIRYCPLADIKIFNSVRTDGDSLIFDKGIQISVDELLELATTSPACILDKDKAYG